jgi:hypothetical protein
MIQRVLLLLLLLLTWLAAPAIAQNTEAYKFSEVIKQESQSGKQGANQYAAWDYSYIGEYLPGLASYTGSLRRSKTLAPADSLAFTALTATDARRYILGRARTEQIIIINEAHHDSRHRVFTASLLPELAKLGFRYLAAEALDEQDTLLQKRGFPVMQTGFYTKEPQFCNLLRVAQQARYQLVPYDYGFSREGEWEERIKARETAQARNIQRILQADPKAKIVVHCGFSHVNEGPNGMGEQPAMAAYLRQLTGIDPFTIDQTALSESGTPTGDLARYRLARAAGSAVFLDASRQPYAGADRNMSVDVNVFHPRTTFAAGRPAWLFTDGRRPVSITPAITIGYPCLVLAYVASEDIAQAVPADVVELQGPQDRKALALRTGRYTIVAKGRTGQTQTWTLAK